MLFLFFITFCYKSTVVLLLSFFYNFLRIPEYLIQCSFAFRSLLVLVKAYRLHLFLQGIFIPGLIQSLLLCILLYLTVKLPWKMFKKVHKNELNMWFGYVSI